MRVLVTGGAGYIGSHTVYALLLAGHHPIVIDNLVYGHEWIVKDILNVPLIIGSVGDKNLMESIITGEHPNLNGTIHEGKSIEGLLHFAAYAYVGESVKNPLKYYKNNVSETINMLDVIFKNLKNNKKGNSKIPIVFSSSCATYGIPQQNPIYETTNQNPINPYGRSKLIIENVLKDLAHSHNLSSLILRYFNAAGASPNGSLGELHEPETHLIPLTIKAAFNNNNILKIFGNDYDTFDGTCIRDYVHVSDLADAHVLALNFLFKKNGQNSLKKGQDDNLCQAFNLGNGKGISIKEIINSVEKITNKNVPFEIVERRKGDPACLVACSLKAREILKWKPKFEEIDTIVLHAYKWFIKNQNL